MQKRPEKPDIEWLSHKLWIGCHDLEEFLPCFQGISKDITRTPIHCKLGRTEIDLNPKEWDGYVDLAKVPDQQFSDDEESSDDKESTDEEQPYVFIPWDERLTEFQKLCLIKTFKEEMVCLLLGYTLSSWF